MTKNNKMKLIIMDIIQSYCTLPNKNNGVQLMFLFKVARARSIIFFFYGLILLWFDNTNKVMRNPKYKFRQSSIVFKKPVFCLKNWELWRAPATSEFNIFCWNFEHISYSSLSAKGCSGCFFILFRYWVICKNQKGPGF